MAKVTLTYQAPGGQAQEFTAYLSKEKRLDLLSVRRKLGLWFIELDGVLVPEDATHSPATYEDGAQVKVSGSQLAAGAASSSGQAGVGAEAGAATVKVVEVLMPEGFDEEPKVYTCKLRGQADYMFVTKDGLWFDGDEIIISFDQLVDGRMYSNTPSLAAQVSNLQGFSRRLVDATEDEVAEAAVDLLSTSLGDKHVQRVCRKKFRDDEAGVAVEVDAMAAGDTKVLVAEVRMELTEDAVDDAQAKVDKLRKLGATGKHDFKFLANKAIVPAVAGVALTKNAEKLRALQDRIKQDGVPVFMINGARRGVGNECFPRTPATLPPGLARKLSSVAHAPRARTAAAMLAAAWAAVWT